jgi:pilus assembly protein Flp/PilA
MVCGWSGRAGDANPAFWVSSDSHVWIKELQMKKLFARFMKDDSGATAIEYGLIAAGISVAIIAVMNGIGTKLFNAFTSENSQLATGGGG